MRAGSITHAGTIAEGILGLGCSTNLNKSFYLCCFKVSLVHLPILAPDPGVAVLVVVAGVLVAVGILGVGSLVSSIHPPLEVPIAKGIEKYPSLNQLFVVIVLFTICKLQKRSR